MIQKADLARYAGQFVWLELNFDKAENQTFLTKYGAVSTPTFYIIDPKDGHVAATQAGAMSLAELEQFLDRGAASVLSQTQDTANAALTHGDALIAKRPDEAITAYREALRLASATWPRRELAEASLATALQTAGEYQQCAETAATEAAGMKRDAMFGRILVAGMWCLVTPDPAPWTDAAAIKLEPLAEEALSLSSTVRDHRDGLYRTLMYLALAHNNQTQAAQWGDRWLKELDSRRPVNEEDRSAIDIARVEDIQTFGDPQRILPALIASERAMPHSWNASLRVAQMEAAAKNFEEAIAACDRGLGRNPGPAGQSWLLRVKADALMQEGKMMEARNVLEKALESAQTIPSEPSRNHTISSIQQALAKSTLKGERN